VSKTHSFTLIGQLPSANQLINAERHNRYRGARLKSDIQYEIIPQIRQQLRNVKIRAPVTIHYLWVEPNKRRDLDNVCFGQKFVQDALVLTGVLKDDGWAQVTGFTHEFVVDKKNPRVVVTLVEGNG